MSEKLVSDCCGVEIYSVPVHCGYTRFITGCGSCARIGDTWICHKCHKPCQPVEAKEEGE